MLEMSDKEIAMAAKKTATVKDAKKKNTAAKPAAAPKPEPKKRGSSPKAR
jgi:hypothetical protein